MDVNVSPLPWSYEIRMDGNLRSCEIVDANKNYVCWIGEDENNEGWAETQASVIVESVNKK